MTWPIVQLKDCARIVGGATPKSEIADYWNGDIPWTTPKDLSDLDGKFLTDTPRKITEQGLRNCSSELLPPNSVLFSSRAPIGHVAINTVPIATNQGFKSMVPGPKLNASFLYWWLRCHRPQLEQLGNGATFKEVSKAVVERIEIPLPPLEEQKRIAAILDQADELRRKRQRALDRLNQLGQAIFIEMFGDPRAESGWNCDVAELSTICRKITDGTHQAPNWADSGIPFLFVSNIRNQRIDMNTKKFVSIEEFESLTKHTKIESRDILYTCVGSYGHTAVVDGSATFAFQRHIAHLKPNLTLVLPHFLAWCLETPNVKAQADKLATGIAQKTVTLSALKQFLVPLPSLDAQNEFESRISEVLRLRDVMELEANRSGQLFSSVQHRAFRGELTVSSLKEAAA